MREFKFRAWNKKTGRMVDLKKVTPLALHSDLIDSGLGGIFLPDSDELIVQQYTGLKSKSGKEIYEGDIFWERCSIEYSDKHAAFVQIGVEEWPCFFNPFNKNIEIIGNIYENPELVEDA